MDKLGYSFLLPSGLLDYFDIINVVDSAPQIVIYLEEKNNLPIDSCGLNVYASKGFFPAVLINDFPVRGRGLLLNIKPRRWIHKETSEYMSRDFGIIAQGTRITQEFASFLKGTHR